MAAAFSLESISDERVARQILAFVVPSTDEITRELLKKSTAVEIVKLALSDDVLPGFASAKTRRWRDRFQGADRGAIRDSLMEGIGAGCGILIPGDKDWPPILDEVEPAPPYALWTKGDTSLLRLRTPGRIAFLGTDTPSDYGSSWASTVADELSREGLHVVALAGPGIPADTIQSALDADGQPIVVAAHPLDAQGDTREAPFDRVSEAGLVLSECPPGRDLGADAALKSHRILTAISGTTLVVEASEDTAPMEAARYAHSVGADVFAIPCDVTREHVGTNLLIAEQTADLIFDAEDVFSIIHLKINIDLFGADEHTAAKSSERSPLSR